MAVGPPKTPRSRIIVRWPKGQTTEPNAIVTEDEDEADAAARDGWAIDDDDAPPAA